MQSARTRTRASKILHLLLAVCLVLATTPLTAAAEEETISFEGLNYKILTQPSNGGHGRVAVGANQGAAVENLSIPETITVYDESGNEIVYDVWAISQNAFANCSGLTGDLTIGDSVRTIGKSAFAGCSGLTGDLTIGGSVETIGESAFDGCSHLTGDLTIPNSVITIEKNAFNNCSGFNGELTIGGSVRTIGNNAFYNCSHLTGDLTIPNSVITIGLDAFYDCVRLNGDLTIGSSVTIIENSTFAGCSRLTGDLIIPESVETIKANAFFDCSRLTGVTIGSSVKTVGNSAFLNCRGLTGVTIGSSVEDIGNKAFAGCRGLTALTFLGDSPPAFGNNVFKDIPEALIVTVPDESKAAYNSALSGLPPDSLIRGTDDGPVSGVMTIGNGDFADLESTDTSGDGWRWIAKDGVLELDNDYDGAPIKISCHKAETVKLVYTGEVTVENSATDDWALYCEGNLNISGVSGDDLLTVINTGDGSAIIARSLSITGPASVSASSSGGHGIKLIDLRANIIDVTGMTGTLTASGSNGIYNKDGSLEIRGAMGEGGKIDATGTSCGIRSSGALTITAAGEINAAATESEGVALSSSGSINISDAAVTATGAGGMSPALITVKSGTLTATGYTISKLAVHGGTVNFTGNIGDITVDGAGADVTITGDVAKSFISDGVTRINGDVQNLSHTGGLLITGGSAAVYYHEGSYNIVLGNDGIGGDLAFFQNLDFHLPAGIANGATMLAAGGTADISEATVSIYGSGLSLNNGDSLVLIDASAGALTGAPANTSVSGGGYNWNLSVSGDKLIATVVPIDTTAPVLTAGTVNRASDTQAAIGFTTNEAGTAYYLVQDSGAAPASAAVVSGGISLGPVSGAVADKPVTLTAGAKDIYVVVQDAGNNTSAPLKITAAAAAPPVKTVFVGGQSGPLTAGIAGSATFPVTTANIANGAYPATL
ncbi:MAG: leucine-rich repeat domain-containing protein, partial [Gracilibacteraceae bacterium]|nr:leucine-rich repeat domain-containing protein [Gracilibacteraceae bacterium]